MDVHTTIVVVCIFIFCFIGLFGNISFIVTVVLNQSIRSSRSILLSTLCIMHSIMLIFNIINVFRLIYGIKLTKEECVFAQSLPPAIYAVSHQAMLYVVLGIDVLLSLIKPFTHSKRSIFPYAAIMQIPCIIYATSYIIASQFFDDDRTISVCNPPEAFPIVVNEIRVKIGICLGCVVLIIYIFIGVLLVRRSPLRTLTSSQTRAIKSVIALTVTYLISWFTTAIVSLLATIMSPTSLFIKLYNNYAVITAMVAYSSTYYVHLFISREYRRLFLDSLLCKPFRPHLERLLNRATTEVSKYNTRMY